MGDYKRLKTPLSEDDILSLKSGDRVLLSGYIYTARDAAHKRLLESLDKGEETPIDLKGIVIYYCGPSPARPGRPIGAAGPTTAYRMDPFTPRMLELGVKGFIGKGKRSKEVIEALKALKGVYFAATGGAGALLSQRIKEAEVVAYEDLGPEAIRKLYVEDFPLIVVNDAYGNDLYEEGRRKYRKI